MPNKLACHEFGDRIAAITPCYAELAEDCRIAAESFWEHALAHFMIPAHLLKTDKEK